jgi:hypothetical protein
MSKSHIPSVPAVHWNTIELGPDLPVADFTSSKHWNSERINALALYCCDGRWGEAFDEFCQKHLRIPRYDRWAVPGGPAWLVPGDEDAGFTQTAHSQLDFLVRAHELDRIVLITHFGCAYYANRLKCEPMECLPVQLDEIRRAAEILRGWYPEMQVESYLAMRSGSCLSFHGVSE